MKKCFLVISVLFVGLWASAATPLDEARALMNAGSFDQAIPLLESQYKKNPKNVTVNECLGKCYYNLEQFGEAEKYFKAAFAKNSAESAKYLALIAFDRYDFHEAEAKMSSYRSILAKAKKEPDSEGIQLASRVDAASSMLDHVEKIVIIDSLCVDRSTFFEAYRLSPESGSLLPYEKADAAPTVVFMPESGDRRMWAECDSAGNLRLMEAIRLLDGEWDEFTQLPDVLNDGGDANYPFMMSDGTTLYYASNGNGSIGGYDIFMTRKDSESGNYLQPQNIGMPYNSPYDDYLLAYDEVNGIGWWATDRNLYEDKLTVYVFITPTMRENYDSADESLASYAAVRNFKDTWKEESYAQLLGSLPAKDAAAEKEPDFEFFAGNGKVYKYYSELRSFDARDKMKQYVALQNNIAADEAKLKSLRSRFAKGDSSVDDEILSLERTIGQNHNQAKSLANTIIKLLQ